MLCFAMNLCRCLLSSQGAVLAMPEMNEKLDCFGPLVFVWEFFENVFYILISLQSLRNVENPPLSSLHPWISTIGVTAARSNSPGAHGWVESKRPNSTLCALWTETVDGWCEDRIFVFSELILHIWGVASLFGPNLAFRLLKGRFLNIHAASIQPLNFIEPTKDVSARFQTWCVFIWCCLATWPLYGTRGTG